MQGIPIARSAASHAPVSNVSKAAGRGKSDNILVHSRGVPITTQESPYNKPHSTCVLLAMEMAMRMRTQSPHTVGTVV
jgi:hypothetical protein